MKEIKLHGGYIAMVDDEDYDTLNKYNWHRSHYGYAERREGGIIKMHKQILGFPELETDHIDGNGLNNQKSNLRICSHADNMRNQKKKKCGLSRYKGVSLNHKWNKTNNYRVSIMKNYKRYHIGYFKTEKEAAVAYNDAAIKYFGEFARLNIID